MRDPGSRLSPGRVGAMIRKEMRQIFRDPKTKRIVFISPVVQLLVFGYAVNTDVRDTTTFAVDHDRTAESRALLDAFTASGYFRIVGRSDRPADLARALDRGEAIVGLEIPVGFARDLRAGRGAGIRLAVDGTNSNTGTIAQGNATRIIESFGRRPARTPAPTVSWPVRDLPGGGPAAAEPAVDLRARAWYNPELESRVYNVPAVIGVLLMLMSLLLTSMTVVRERELGTLDQLMVSPLRPLELMLGKTVPVAIIALVDLALITAVAMVWFEIPLRGSLLFLLAASVIYILAGLSFGLLISTGASTQQEAFMTMFLFFLPAIILSGFLYPVSSMPVLFRWLTLLDPIRHFLEIVRGIFLKGIGLRELWPQLGALVLMAGGALALATARFRRSVG